MYHKNILSLKNATVRRQHFYVFTCSPWSSRTAGWQCRSWSCKQTGRKSGTRRNRRSSRCRKDYEFPMLRCVSFFQPSVSVDFFVVSIVLQKWQNVNNFVLVHWHCWQLFCIFFANTCHLGEFCIETTCKLPFLPNKKICKSRYILPKLLATQAT